MSFHEKSTIASLTATILVYGWYFFTYISRALGAETTPAASIVTKPLIVTVIAVIAINVAAHILIGWQAAREDGELESAPDEREKLIELRGASRGSYVLAFGTVMTIGALLMEHEPFWIANILLGFFILSEVVKGASKLIDFRRGI